MIEYKLDDITCMGGWFIPEKVCDDLIELYNQNKSFTKKGEVGENEYVPEKKQSTEFTIPFDNNFLAFKNYVLCCWIKFTSRSRNIFRKIKIIWQVINLQYQI